MWSQGGGEPVESYLSKKPLRYIIMLRERNYFISLFQKCQAKKKKKHTQIFQTTVSDPTADFLTPPLSSNPQPQLMNLPLISLKKEKKRKRASICSYYQVNPHTWMDGLCSWVRLASSFLEHSPTSRLCS